jgi:integrase
MPRRSEFFVKVGDGPTEKTVGYSAKERTRGRETLLAVVFLDPQGKRLEKMTTCKMRGGNPDQDYHNEAMRLIDRSYASSFPCPERVKWDEALNKVEKTAPDLRPDTLIAYRKSVRIFRTTLEGEKINIAAPFEVTPAVASQFARIWLAGTYKRSKAANAKEYKRRPTTLAFYLRQLSALWEQFRDLGYVPDNPWKTVRKPQTDKVRKAVPTEEEINAFFVWVRNRYPKWDRLHALLELKALSGCRSQDICQLRTVQLVKGRVVWSAEQTKQREGRSVLVPDDLFGKLRRLAGPVFLWEHFLDDIRKFRPSKNRMADTFNPKTVFWVMNNIFREYVEKHPENANLTPHSLRRRAITITVTETQSVDATASAIGLNPATARRYYLDNQRAFNTDEIFRKLSGSLLPKKKPKGKRL